MIQQGVQMNVSGSQPGNVIPMTSQTLPSNSHPVSHVPVQKLVSQGNNVVSAKNNSKLTVNMTKHPLPLDQVQLKGHKQPLVTKQELKIGRQAQAIQTSNSSSNLGIQVPQTAQQSHQARNIGFQVPQVAQPSSSRPNIGVPVSQTVQPSSWRPNIGVPVSQTVQPSSSRPNIGGQVSQYAQPSNSMANFSFQNPQIAQSSNPMTNLGLQVPAYDPPRNQVSNSGFQFQSNMMNYQQTPNTYSSPPLTQSYPRISATVYQPPITQHQNISFSQANTHSGQFQPNGHVNSNNLHQPSSVFMQANMDDRNNIPQWANQPNGTLDVEYDSEDDLFNDTAGNRLTQEQIAARHIMPKNLPKFDGNPSKWQMFYSAFKNSTKTCGFTNSENMGRLIDCLRGDAQDAVQARLVHPNQVRAVIKTLKLMYGRPEIIIETMLEKVQNEPPPKENDLNTLIKFAISVQNICDAIKETGAREHLRNPSLMNALMDKLPSQIQLNWAYYKHSNQNVDLASFGNWLFELATVASQVVRKPLTKKKTKNESQGKNESQSKNESKSQPKTFVNSQVETKPKVRESSKSGSSSKTKECPACNDSCSRIYHCKKFKELPRPEKWIIVKKNKLCSRCLGDHPYYRCQSKYDCRVEGCSSKHHTLLHNYDKSETDDKKRNGKKSDEKRSTDKNAANSDEKGIHSNAQRSKDASRVDIFRIVPVRIYNKNKSTITYAYLDDGSNLTSMESDLADEIDLTGTLEPLCVDWAFGQTHELERSKSVSVEISGNFKEAPLFKLNNVRTVDDLHLPTQSLTSEWIDQYSHLQGIPISTYESARPRMIIGLQYSRLMISLKTVESASDKPIACKTRLGWVVQGPSYDDGTTRMKKQPVSLNACECQSSDNELHQLVKQYFTIENFGVNVTEKILESKQIQRAKYILESTTTKVDRRYETGLLWKFDKITLPDSYPMALKRLKCLEAKLAKNSQLKDNLCGQFRDFIDKKYIRKLSEKELVEKHDVVWYLPIFPVFNPKKPEKVRIVWDAAKVKNVSLNSMLLTGPDQLVPLFTLLIQFREKQIAVTGDLKEMYHQVRLRAQDQHAQRFLWRDGDSSRKPDVYVMEVLTFGATSSPSTAQYIKNENASEFKEKYPRAVEAIVKKHYVDDFIDCTHTVDEATKLVKEAKHIHHQASFELRNFTSNSKELLHNIGETTNQQNKNMNISPQSGAERVLGMFWNTDTDEFVFSLKYTQVNEKILSGEHCPTKREVLRILMSVFDPLGLLANFLVYGKILLQEIWRTNIGWDEQITPQSRVKWNKWIKALPNVENIRIPRLYSRKISPRPPKSIQLHVFVDAGEGAFAATTFWRIEDESGVDCCLVAAKTKVAPNKPMSMPRLELQGAVLGTRLAQSLKSSSTLKIEKTVFWTDSKTVMGWINSEARRFSQFVAFRIGEILDSTEANEWRWVPSGQNVAGEATKAKEVPKIYSSSRWYKGPEFLYDDESTWFTEENVEYTTEEEIRPCFVMSCVGYQKEQLFIYDRIPHWERLVSVQAYVFRFVHNTRCAKHQRRLGNLSQEEIVMAENHLYQRAQRDVFLDEILIVKYNETVSEEQQKSFDKSSQLLKCSPYIDEHGVLRIRGRIDAATCIPTEAKRPIILPRRHHITKLVVDYYHRRYQHINHQTALNEIRQKYYIPALRVVMKSIRSSCQRCKNLSAMPQIPEMAELPPARLAAYELPFTFVGVDYFGPLHVKVKRSSEKRYGVIFTCLTTRAIHLEVAHSLNTSSCIISVRNFMCRRGSPREFYSDNGTNFHGLENELREEFMKLNQSEMEQEFTNAEMTWKFNPPAASHMGGVWERLIRTVKGCFKQITTTRNPTDEMLPNLLYEVENIVYSRPLTYISLDSADDEALTPNHFLLGSSNGLKPPGTFTPKDLSRNNWKTIQEQTNQFWRRFVLEYMPTILRRTKWLKQVTPIKVGDIVLIVDERNERNTWPKGIVEQIFVGKGGKRRQAVVKTVKATFVKDKNGKSTIKTDTGTYRRPVSKLAVLDVRKPADDQEVKLNQTESINGEENVGQRCTSSSTDLQ